MDVRQVKTNVTAIAVDNNPANRGTISAYVMVQGKSFSGMTYHKRVRIGVEFGVNIETAKEMMKDIRNDNTTFSGTEPNIMGRFVMEL